MKAIKYIASLLVLVLLVSCQNELKPGAAALDADAVKVTLSVQFPEPVPAPTKAKMGEGPTADAFEIHLCLFGPGDGYVQNWIPTTLATPTVDAQGYITGGNFSVYLPITDEKRTIHVIANPPAAVTPTTEDYLDNVMEKMVNHKGADDECSYWQEIVLENGITAHYDGTNLVADATVTTALTNIQLVRNFAKVIVTSPASTAEDYEDFTVKRWTLINVPDMGYVAPYTGNTTKRFPAGYLNAFLKDNPTGTALLAMLADDNYLGYMPPEAQIDQAFPGDPDDTAYAGLYANNGQALYMYERPLPTSDQKQTAVLVEVEFAAGHTLAPDANKTYWYKIELLDDNGSYVPILRDIVYTLKIKGLEVAGEDTAEEAFNGAYSGNISASLETASLTELSNGKSLIHVDQLDYTFMSAGTYQLMVDESTAAEYYFIPDVNNGTQYRASASGICEIKVELLPVTGYEAAVTTLTVGTGSYEGTLSVEVGEPGTSIKKSIIRVSGRKGDPGLANTEKYIYREIMVNLMNQQDFANGTSVTAITNTPTITGSGNEVDFSLFLPADLGSSMFPIQVRIEAENNSLSATTPDLPVTTGKSVFDSSRNTYYFIYTIDYSDYCKLNSRTKKYEYTYQYDFTMYTSKPGDNSTKIDIRDLAGNFNPKVLILGTVAP